MYTASHTFSRSCRRNAARRAPRRRGQLGERRQPSVPRGLAHELLRARRVAGDLADLELAAQRDDRRRRRRDAPRRSCPSRPRRGTGACRSAARPTRRQDAADARAHHLEHEVVVPDRDELRLAGRARGREERETTRDRAMEAASSGSRGPRIGTCRLERDRGRGPAAGSSGVATTRRAPTRSARRDRAGAPSCRGAARHARRRATRGRARRRSGRARRRRTARRSRRARRADRRAMRRSRRPVRAARRT